MEKINCTYCGNVIPKGTYQSKVIFNRFIRGEIGLYCDSTCKHRAGTLRMAVKNKKYMPKTLDETDKKFMQNYVNELSLSRNDIK